MGSRSGARCFPVKRGAVPAWQAAGGSGRSCQCSSRRGAGRGVRASPSNRRGSMKVHRFRPGTLFPPPQVQPPDTAIHKRSSPAPANPFIPPRHLLRGCLGNGLSLGTGELCEAISSPLMRRSWSQGNHCANCSLLIEDDIGIPGYGTVSNQS